MSSSLATGNPQAEDRKDTERIARLVAMARQGQGQLSLPETKLLKKIQREREKHAKAQADWQRRAAAHRQKISMLLDQLEQVRSPRPEGRFQQAAAQPRVVGKGNRKAISKARATRRAPAPEPPARVAMPRKERVQQQMRQQSRRLAKRSIPAQAKAARGIPAQQEVVRAPLRRIKSVPWLR